MPPARAGGIGGLEQPSPLAFPPFSPPFPPHLSAPQERIFTRRSFSIASLLSMATSAQPTTNELPQLLARGPWELSQVKTRWRSEHFEPSPAHTKAADAEIASLLQRGSPSHGGVAGRLGGFKQSPHGLE